jgi:hypothetical protein|tara:strand:+ start:149 stop:679 length:531 start_codon:yes stop_codon:yes gene_type:complete
MKSSTMYKNAYSDETIYKTDTATSNFADTTKYIWNGGTKTILVNAAMVNASYIRLPEATTSNAGLIVKVIYALSPAALTHVGFVTSLIVGGASTIGAATEGNAPTDAAMVSSAVGTSNLRLDLDVNVAGKAGGHPGTELAFYYTGVANVVIFKGVMHSDVDDATLAALFSTTAVNA